MEAGEGLTRIVVRRQRVLTFPTNKLPFAVVICRDRVKKRSGFVGTAGIDWGGRPGYKDPATDTTWSRVRYHATKEGNEIPGE